MMESVSPNQPQEVQLAVSSVQDSVGLPSNRGLQGQLRGMPTSSIDPKIVDSGAVRNAYTTAPVMVPKSGPGMDSVRSVNTGVMPYSLPNSFSVNQDGQRLPPASSVQTNAVRGQVAGDGIPSTGRTNVIGDQMLNARSVSTAPIVANVPTLSNAQATPSTYQIQSSHGDPAVGSGMSFGHMGSSYSGCTPGPAGPNSIQSCDGTGLHLDHSSLPKMSPNRIFPQPPPLAPPYPSPDHRSASSAASNQLPPAGTANARSDSPTFQCPTQAIGAQVACTSGMYGSNSPPLNANLSAQLPRPVSSRDFVTPPPPVHPPATTASQRPMGYDRTSPMLPPTPRTSTSQPPMPPMAPQPYTVHSVPRPPSAPSPGVSLSHPLVEPSRTQFGNFPPRTQQFPRPNDPYRPIPIPPTSAPLPPQAASTNPSAYSAYPSGHHSNSVVPPRIPPVRPDMIHAPTPPYQHQIPHDHSAVFRSPGTPATGAEWNRIKSPIGLLQERCLLPTDSADLPPKPAIPTPVNCDPDVMRCTLTNVPGNSKLLARCRLPLGLIMHPFRDLSSLHTINSTVIVRCRSCRTYINPFVQFIDSGRRWRCPVCLLANSVPDDFYYDPGTQTYGDPARRPEIRSATVEFIAPSEYMLRPPQPATYLFCFDVSRNAIATGYLHFACERLAASLDRMPGDSRRQIAFMTFDSAVHFYKLCGETMKLMVCPDLEDPFLPDYEGLVNRVDGSSEIFQDFLSRLPGSFARTNDVNNCLGTTLQLALKLIGGTGGRITLFTTSLPNVGAGSLEIREEVSDRTSTEIKHLGPAVDFYKTFALDCAAQQVAVDLFIMNSQYCDIATLSGAARFSSGCVYHYPEFYHPPKFDPNSDESRSNGPPVEVQTPAAAVEVERFRRDFDRYLSRKIGFEAVMRIRCTHGIAIQTFHGCFFVRSTDLMSLPNVNPDAGFAVQLGIQDSVEKFSTVCFQAAILYTSSKGDRRIRVHTLCLPVVHNASEVFQGADQGAIACLIGKMAVDRAISSGLPNAREAMVAAVADALAAFASAIGITPGASISSYALACPPNLRLLPLYICGLLRYRAFEIGLPLRLDDRSAALERIKSAPPEDLLALCYPRLYAVHRFASKPFVSNAASLAQKAAALSLNNCGDSQQADDEDEDSSSTESSCALNEAEQLPGQLHLTAQSISRDGVYLLDTGELFLLLVGTGLDPATNQSGSSELLKQLLNISSPDELPAYGGPFALPPLPPPDQEHSDTKPPIPAARRRLSALITLLRRRRATNNALVCMRHDAPASLRTRFLAAFVEDRTESAPSYHEFLQMVENLMKV